MEWLVKTIIKRYGGLENPQSRERCGKLGSLIGIIANILLFGGKFTIGSAANSVAIIADAVNNFSDAGSSVVALISFRLSGKPADKEHPFGHARIEYIASMAVAVLILILGGELLRSSIGYILHPKLVLYSGAMIWVLVVSILVKLGLFVFNRSLGRKIGSPVMIATAADCLSDVMATSGVLLATLIGQATDLLLDGWVGMLVAGFIIWSGVGIIRDALDKLLGEAPSPELTQKIQDFVLKHEGIIGVHDLVVHNYGPNRCFASLHAEVPSSQDVLVSHDIIDNIEREMALNHGIHLVIHLDPVVIDDPEINILRARVEALVSNLGCGLSVHDFRLVRGPTYSTIIFDVDIQEMCHLTDQELLANLRKNITALGDYHLIVNLDRTYFSRWDKGES